MPGIDSYTKLMLHMDGTNGSTTFTDSELAPTKTVTANGSAQISTAKFKFGGASGLFASATSDYLSTPDSADWAFGSGDFTIDFWMNSTQATLTQLIGQWKDGGGTDRGWSIELNSTANKISFFTRVEPNSVGVTSTTSVNDGNWHHIAAVRNGNVFSLYIDGTSEGTPVTQAGSLNDSTDQLLIAAYNNNPTIAFFYDGNIDELRISNGTARWTSNFTPPTSAYDDGTILINLSDSVTTSEYVDVLRAGARDINVNDATTVTDSPTVFIPAYLKNNLQAWWKFDESSGNPADSSGNNNTLTNVNTATFVSGVINNAVNLTAASSQWLSILNANQTGLSFSSDLSISQFVNFASLPPGPGVAQYAMFSLYKRDEAANQRSYALYYYDDGVTPQVNFAVDKDLAGSGPTDIYEYDITFTTGTWYHLVVVWTASTHTAQFYLNGSLAHTSTGHQGYTSIPVGTAPVLVGAYADANHSAGESFFDGKIDLLGAWNRTLSSTEVTQLYNNGLGLDPFVVDFTVNVNDSLSTSESVTVAISNLGDINVNDTEGPTTESVSITFPLTLSVSDSTSTSESINVFSPVLPLVSTDYAHAQDSTLNQPYQDTNVASISGGTGVSGELGQAAAQQFTATGTLLAQITTLVFKAGNPLDNLILNLRTSLGGTSLFSASIAASSLAPGGPQTATWTPSSPVALTAGTPYYIEMTRDGARDQTNECGWYRTIPLTDTTPNGSGDVLPGAVSYLLDNTVWDAEPYGPSVQTFSITYGDNPVLLLFDFPSIFDSTSTSESVSVTFPLELSIFDSASTSEFVKASLLDEESIFDSTSTSEFVSVKFDLTISVFDSTVTSEFVNLNIFVQDSIFDTITVSEQAVVQLPVTGASFSPNSLRASDLVPRTFGSGQF